MSHWIYQNQQLNDLPDGVFGFVYRITSLIDQKKYIGRKYVTKSIRKAVKKKDGTMSVKKKKVVSESDWRFYTGTCSPLNIDIKKNGKENFKFEILAFGYTKGQTNFLEEHIQHRLNVLCDPEYYNDSIGARGFIGVKIDDAFKDMLKSIEL